MNEYKAESTAPFHQAFVHQVAGSWSFERAGQMADIRTACRIVLLITREMAQVAGDRDPGADPIKNVSSGTLVPRQAQLEELPEEDRP